MPVTVVTAGFDRYVTIMSIMSVLGVIVAIGGYRGANRSADAGANDRAFAVAELVTDDGTYRTTSSAANYRFYFITRERYVGATQQTECNKRLLQLHRRGPSTNRYATSVGPASGADVICHTVSQATCSASSVARHRFDEPAG